MTHSTSRCHAHDTETRLTCARCEVPICPRCLHRTAVGLRCGDCAAPADRPGRGARRQVAVPVAVLVVVSLTAVTGLMAADLLGGGSTGGEQPPAEIVLGDAAADRLQGVVDEIADKAVGGAVVWVDAGGRQLGVAAGEADRRSQQPLTGREAFRLPAVSRMLTVTVAWQLIEDGHLALDEPIAELIPEQAARFDHGEEITVDDLLGHTSGLAEYDTDRFVAHVTDRLSVTDGVVAASCPTAGQRMDLVGYAAAQPPRFEPAARREPSNTDNVLLRHVVQAAAGKPLAEVYRTRVLTPLGMDHTWLPCADSPRGQLARGYAVADLTPVSDAATDVVDVTELDRSVGTPAADVVSTGPDLATFARALIDGDLFDDPATLTAMRNHHKPGSGADHSPGRDSKHSIIDHAGINPGYSAVVRHYPSTDAIIIALSNQAVRPSRRPPAPAAAANSLRALTSTSNGQTGR